MQERKEKPPSELRRAIDRFERYSTDGNPFGWAHTFFGVRSRLKTSPNKTPDSLMEDLQSMRTIVIAGAKEKQ